MALEREALSHNIEDDLALRNRNWDKIEAHLAESANKHIHSSGENWIRFDDGTQICYDRCAFDNTSEYGSGTYSDPYRSDSISIEYPVPFASVPMVTATCAPVPEVTGVGRGVVAIVQNLGTRGCDVRVFRITSYSGEVRVTVSVQAIGRWK